MVRWRPALTGDSLSEQQEKPRHRVTAYERWEAELSLESFAAWCERQERLGLLSAGWGGINEDPQPPPGGG